MSDDYRRKDDTAITLLLQQHRDMRESMEDGFSAITDHISSLAADVSAINARHTTEIENLYNDVDDLKPRVTAVEDAVSRAKGAIWAGGALAGVVGAVGSYLWTKISGGH